jgi:hypothetical protein
MTHPRRCGNCGRRGICFFETTSLPLSGIAFFALQPADHASVGIVSINLNDKVALECWNEFGVAGAVVSADDGGRLGSSPSVARH